MRRIDPYRVWIGNAGDSGKVELLFNLGIHAVVDLALNEPASTFPREFAYLRFPLVDGSGNPPWLLQSAVHVVAELLSNDVPTFVFCGAGMSRSPAIVAAAVAVAFGRDFDETLADVARGSADVSPAIWSDIRLAFPAQSDG